MIRNKQTDKKKHMEHTFQKKKKFKRKNLSNRLLIVLTASGKKALKRKPIAGGELYFLFCI